MSRLTFDSLRLANELRLPQFKNRKGEPSHLRADGSDWSPSDWTNALAGEAGEAANIAKKIRRGDFALDDLVSIDGHVCTVREHMAEELADVVTYADLAAKRCGIDLGAAVISKFNEISERVDASIRILDSGTVVDIFDNTAAYSEGV